MYEYHKVGVDAVKHRTLVSVTEIVDIARHLRQKTPQRFGGWICLRLQIKRSKERTYSTGPVKGD